MASSPLTQDGAARKEIVSLCFSVVKYEAGAGTNAAHSLEGADRVYARKGLCTTWLDELVKPVLAGKKPWPAGRGAASPPASPAAGQDTTRDVPLSSWSEGVPS